MNKQDYFAAALQAGCHKRLDWAVSAFTVSMGQAPEAYAYALCADPLAYYYLDGQGQRVEIEGAKPNEPLFTYRDEIITLKAGALPNLKTDVETTYGEWLANKLLISDVFGDKIDYIAARFSIKDIEKKMLENFQNDPPAGEAGKPNTFYVSEYLAFSKAVFFMDGMSQIFTIGVTEKTVLPPPGLKEFREKLIKENEGKLNDAVTISNIEKQIVAFDAEWRKDDPGNRFLITKKHTDVTRKNTALIYGGVQDASGNANRLTLIPKSLQEGWDMDQFAAMCTTSRLGSYSRGAETMLGGVETKWLLRASSNMNVSTQDCGSKLGIPVLIDEKNKARYAGFTFLVSGKAVAIETAADAGAYLGRVVMVRSPMYCKAGQTDYCHVCVGKRLSATPYALSSAVANFGATFLAISLAAAHGKGIQTEILDTTSDLIDMN
jgi:hypothetical protein